MKKLAITLATVALTVGVIYASSFKPNQTASQNPPVNDKQCAITFGQVYGTGKTKNAAYGAAYAKIPNGYLPLKVNYTSGTGWTCRIEYGK